jgi:hypothetical protein
MQLMQAHAMSKQATQPRGISKTGGILQRSTKTIVVSSQTLIQWKAIKIEQGKENVNPSSKLFKS